MGRPASIAASAMETDLSGNPTAYYIHGLGMICRLDAAQANPAYYHYDYRGSTIAITNASQTVTHRYAYGTFGEMAAVTENGFPNSYRYVGKFGVQYEDNNLYFMRARYYNPQKGRFLGEDPIWNTNLFGYVENNPINGIDATGSTTNWILNMRLVNNAAWLLLSADWRGLEIIGTINKVKNLNNDNFDFNFSVGVVPVPFSYYDKKGKPNRVASAVLRFDVWRRMYDEGDKSTAVKVNMMIEASNILSEIIWFFANMTDEEKEKTAYIEIIGEEKRNVTVQEYYDNFINKYVESYNKAATFN